MSAWLSFEISSKPQAAPQKAGVPTVPGTGMLVVMELCCPGSPFALNACPQPKLMLSAGVNSWVRNTQVPLRVRSFWNLNERRHITMQHFENAADRGLGRKRIECCD